MNKATVIQARLLQLAAGLQQVEEQVRQEGDADGADCLAAMAAWHKLSAEAVSLMSSPAATTGQRRIVFGKSDEELIFTASLLTVWWASLATPFALRARLRALSEEAEALSDEVEKVLRELPPIPARELN
ncbi:MAG TPA: hypothetical protein V6D08_12185 [Candidatus Obscuribacterales bacterium]